MKKYIEVLEDIRQNSDKLKTLTAEKNSLVESYKNIQDVRKRIEQKHTVDDDITAVSKQIVDCEIAAKILNSNAKVALFHEVMPVILEIIAKYDGKPYGEKTKQKISDEVEQKTNCKFYINNSWSYNYVVYPIGDYSVAHEFECGTDCAEGSKRPIMVDNKIQAISFDELGLYYMYNDFVDDVPSRVRILKDTHAEAEQKQRELQAICEKYNRLAVGGDFALLDYSKHIYDSMTY